MTDRRSVPAGIRYVITLDADTRLPRDAAAALVGTMAHPLNRPVYDAQAGRVVDGHGVLQPRITPTLPVGRSESLFQRIFSGPAGADPYALAISDVYQDLFGEGSYTGKGIYDVDTFQAALADRVPENTLLSHDLFEGLFARAALVTDIELFEESPSHYEEAARRQHRWARGDWQLLPWILAGTAGGRDPARIPLLSRWKMLDNLRRTLSRPAAWLTLVGAWVLAGSAPLVWTRLVLVAIAVPALIPASLELLPQRAGVSKRNHLRTVGRDVLLAGAQILLDVALLAHQTWLMADAIGRTLVRLVVTRRHLLEWVTAAQSRTGLTLDLAGAYRRMVGAPILAGVAALLVGLLRPESWMLALPFIALWAGSPMIAWWISRPPRVKPSERLSEAETRLLRATARRTWRFFEAFVGPEDHHLPPDNFQEDPNPVLAHRTSPTNVGLYLLATLAARDFGWLGTLDTIDRLEATLGGVRQLERFRGHFYNWYDTRRLAPLEPRYVSTVDSGNLAGHLLAVEIACRRLLVRPLREPESCRGVDDALGLVREAEGRLADDRRTQTVSRVDLTHAIEDVTLVLADCPTSGGAGGSDSRRLRTLAGTLADVAQALTAERGDPADSEVLDWARAVRATVTSHARDADAFLPWAPHLEAVASTMLSPAGAEVRRRLLDDDLTLAAVPGRCHALAAELKAVGKAATDAGPAGAETVARVTDLVEAVERATIAAQAAIQRVTAICRLARELFEAMRFDFLFDPTRKVFAIGYRVADGTLDAGAYDLLASEARLASFVAIAKGDVPTSHWFRLGRPMTPVGLGAALVSWSGSMFEYLMPALVMQSPSGSLLDQTYRAVVARQQRYGHEHGVPWGISESAHNVRDLDLTYQYSSFGVPGLGLERGLSEDLVVAPYATALAAMVDAPAAARNLAALTAVGARGRYGFYEALDYTRSRLRENARVAVVRAYMAHHQGMTLLALANVLRDGVVRRWFHGERIVQAAELLLQERPPEDVAVARPRVEEVRAPAHVRDFVEPAFRQFTSVDDPLPRTHLLSNGRYSVMVTAAGSGYSRCDGLAITRWREDRHPGPLGDLRLLARCRVRTGMVGYPSTGWGRRRYVHRQLLRGPRRVPPARRHGHHDPRGDRLARGRRRAPSRIAHQLRRGAAGDRDHLVRRAGARATRRGGGAPGLLEPVRADRVRPAPGRPVGHPPPPRARGAVPLGRPRGQRGGTEQWRGAVRDGSLAISRARPRHPDADVGDRRPAAVEHDRLGARPDLQPQAAGAPGAGGQRAHPLLDPGGPESRRGLGARGQVSRSRDVRALGDAGVDPGAGPVPPPRHRPGRGPPVPAPGQPDPLLRPGSPRARRASSSGTGRALGRSGANGSRATSHRARADRRGRGPGHRPPAPARPRVLAHEGPRGGSGHPQREAALLSCRTSRPRSRAWCGRASRPCGTSSTRPTGASSCCAPTSSLPAERDALPRRGSRHPAEPTGHARRAGGAGRAAPASAAEARPAPLPRSAEPRPRRPRSARSWSSSTVWAASWTDGREYVIAARRPGSGRPPRGSTSSPTSDFGFQVSESGVRLHVGGEQPGEPAHALVERSGQRPAGRGHLRARRRDRRPLGARRCCPSARRPGPTSCATGRATAASSTSPTASRSSCSSTCRSRIPSRSPGSRSRTGPAGRAGSRVTAYVEWVLGRSRGATAPFIVTELDERTGALLARNAWTLDFAGRVAFLDLRRRRRPRGRATAPRSWGGNGTLDHPAALERGERLSGRVGAGLDPCGALQDHARARGRRAGRGRRPARARRRRAEDARALVARYRAADLDARPSRR